MGTFGFSRVGVLIVEDNAYIRQALEELLFHFQFGRIVTAKDGEEAVDYTKTLGGAGSIIAPDIIVSDLVMSPINGLLFLRWMRTSKEPPNKMIPFIMLSGAADEGYVHSASDLGATEFLAKPFSATAVYNHFLKIVQYPRQFVTTTNYFGPDRRRRKIDPSKERREKDEKDVEIVKARIDAMGAVLREKVSGDGGEIGRALLASLKKPSNPMKSWLTGRKCKNKQLSGRYPVFRVSSISISTTSIRASSLSAPRLIALT